MSFARIRIFILILALFSYVPTITQAADTVTVYPAPTGISPSPQYTVSVTQNKNAQNSFVYQSQNPGFANGQPTGAMSSSKLEQAVSWTTFSFSGSATISINNQHAFTSARVLPSSKHIPLTVSGNTVSFTIATPGQYAVDFCTTGTTCTESSVDLSNPILIFANPPETSIPNKETPNVAYFGPGVYDLGTTPYVLNSNQTAYLAGGAYVKGFFQIADGATSWAIRGRGILSGENIQNRKKGDCGHGNCFPMISSTNETLGTIEGITIIQSPLYNIAMGGYNAKFPTDNAATQNTIDNIKLISWHGNADGIAPAYGSADPGSVIKNTFLKVGDSAIHLNSSNLLVSNCTIWQHDTSAPFEISDTTGGNLNVDIHNVKVQDTDIIRTEHNAETDKLEAAIFSAHHGGKGNLSDYLFDNIRIENSNLRLFSIVLRPSPWSKKNTQLASIHNFLFRNITVTDPQIMPDLFQSYDRQHQVSDIHFDNVNVAGKSLGTSPAITFNANRRMSLAGNVAYDPLWRDTQNPASFQTWIFNPASAPAPDYSVVAVSEPNLKDYREEAIGDFYGTGAATVLFSNNGALGIWTNPLHTQNLPWAQEYATIGYQLASGEQVIGVGDFNGDGFSDILLWNFTAQNGKVLLMHGNQITQTYPVRPARSAHWNAAWIGDFDQNGYSDILLRDDAGNIEILSFGIGNKLVSTDLPASGLIYHSTNNYAQQNGRSSGIFDASWNIAAVGDFHGLGYAGILWYNRTSGDLGMTVLAPDFQTAASKPVILSNVFIHLPANDVVNFMGQGDFDANGTSDVFVQGATQSMILYTNLWTQGSGYIPGSARIPTPANWKMQK